MLNLDQIGSNWPHLAYINVFLIFKSLVKKMRKSIVLMEKKVMGTCFKEEK